MLLNSCCSANRLVTSQVFPAEQLTPPCQVMTSQCQVGPRTLCLANINEVSCTHRLLEAGSGKIRRRFCCIVTCCAKCFLLIHCTLLQMPLCTYAPCCCPVSFWCFACACMLPLPDCSCLTNICMSACHAQQCWTAPPRPIQNNRSHLRQDRMCFLRVCAKAPRKDRKACSFGRHVTDTMLGRNNQDQTHTQLSR